MPKSIAEEPFESSELLYRRLIDTWFEGSKVLASAIDLEGCSVDRQKFTEAKESLDRGLESEIALAETTFSFLPDGFSHDQSPDDYESFVEHCPENGNDAHCHLKVQKAGYSPGEAWDKKKPKSKLFRRHIREELAKQFTVILTRQ